LLSLAYQQARQTGLRGFLAYYEQALEVYRKLGNLHVLGGFLVDIGVGLALSYRGKRLRGKRARVLAYWRVGLDVKRLARRVRTTEISGSGEDELSPLLALDEREQVFVASFEDKELERLKQRWGSSAFQQAWSASEEYYRALAASFVPSLRGPSATRDSAEASGEPIGDQIHQQACLQEECGTLAGARQRNRRR